MKYKRTLKSVFYYFVQKVDLVLKVVDGVGDGQLEEKLLHQVVGLG
jgi:hypothetical protein